MQYRNNRLGEPISALGYGCMRFTKDGRGIDIDKAEKEIMEAYALGVNYYDTAYVYPGSEVALGEILERNKIRDKVNIATKLPQYLVGSLNSAEKYFNEELNRLKTTYIDYYLMHFMTDISQWEKLKKMGIEEWISKKKEAGLIRNIGFSYHGNTDNFIKILNSFDWDFCQIQYNYLDEHSQAGATGLKAAAEKGIPVIIMEPLRGGKLVDMLPEEAKKLIKESDTGFTAAELALRWLWDQPEVTCILSGMNSLDMVRENCRIADECTAGSFSEEGRELVEQVRNMITSSMKVGCTECRYCMPCPKGVDIPAIFRCYNRMYSESKNSGRHEYLQAVALNGAPSFATQCVGCKSCEKHCPQGIKITEEIKNADRQLRPLPYKIAITVARKFMLRK